MKELKKFITEELPVNGEWWKGGDETFIHNAKIMLKAGIKKDDVKEILESSYWAVASEFGN